MEDRVTTENITIVLVEPHIPENIGFVARAMNNTGLRHLSVVRPKNCDLNRVLKTATGTSIDLIEKMKVSADLKEILGPVQYVVGTTARTGSQRPALTDPRSLAAELVGISRQNSIAILFGPEDRGLSNEHLRYCNTIATIPTASFWSLNIAHAVLIFCYEIMMASRPPDEREIPRLADRFELEGMYDHLGEVLGRIGFLNPQNPEHWMLNIRRFLSRLPLRAREVRIVRGICRQIEWFIAQAEKDHTKKKD